MTIDLRSDAVTEPTDEMWDAMRSARLGWAAVGEDSHVRELEEHVVAFLGKEAGLLVPSGTTANLLALLGQAERGDQVIFDDLSHMLWSEEWGFAYVGGLVHRAIKGTGGRIAPGDLDAAIRLHSFGHRPRTALVCLENSHNAAGGAVLPPDYMAEIGRVVRKHGILLHVDGARILNASAALNVDVRTLVKDADSVSFNLNKGLSAPMGAVLCGSRQFIERSRLNIRRLGAGSLHQAGIFAAAGLVAMKTMIPQLAIDNRRAKDLASAVSKSLDSRFSLSPVETNVVFLSAREPRLDGRELQTRLKELDVLVTLASEDTVRMVTHRHIDDSHIEAVGNVMKKIAAR